MDVGARSQSPFPVVRREGDFGGTCGQEATRFSLKKVEGTFREVTIHRNLLTSTLQRAE